MLLKVEVCMFQILLVYSYNKQTFTITFFYLLVRNIVKLHDRTSDTLLSQLVNINRTHSPSIDEVISFYFYDILLLN